MPPLTPDPCASRPGPVLDVCTGSVEDAPSGGHLIRLDPLYETIEEVKADLGPEIIAELVEAVAAPSDTPRNREDLLREALQALEANLDGLDLDRPDLDVLEAGTQIARSAAAASYAEATNSFVFAQAASLQIASAGPSYFLLNTSGDGPPTVLLNVSTPSNQDRKIVWAIGFVGELLLGILALAGVPVKGGNKIARVARKVMKNQRLRDLVAGLIAGVSAANLFSFLKALYDEGLLGFAVGELAEDLGYFAILAIIATIIGYFIPGAGQARLLVGLGALGVDLGLKLANKP